MKLNTRLVIFAVLCVLVFVLLYLTLGCKAVSDPVEIQLTYTATGDDLYTGQATTQDLRWSYDPITNTNWQNATVILGLPQPPPSGDVVVIIVPNMPSDTVVYFAVVLCDEVGNCSGISNVTEVRTDDMTSPAEVSDLREL